MAFYSTKEIYRLGDNTYGKKSRNNLKRDRCPIIREDDGLAKSSRNTYLNGEERQAALVLNRSLKAGKALVDAGETRACVIKSAITAEIEKEPLAKIDYVDVVDFDTITPVEKLEGSILVAIAVYIGKTRLIDNFIVEK